MDAQDKVNLMIHPRKLKRSTGSSPTSCALLPTAYDAACAGRSERAKRKGVMHSGLLLEDDVELCQYTLVPLDQQLGVLSN